MSDPQAIIAFMRFAEPLKNVLRHSYTSAGRRESVAEHSWMLSLLGMLVLPHIATPVDQLKVLKMLIIHDLAEAITGDIPVFDKASIAEQAKADELAAMRAMVAPLPPALREEILALHDEYEARESFEARLASAIDKAEALIQHNLADITSWDQHDYAYQADFQHPRNALFAIDPFIQALKAQIDHDTITKIEQAGQSHRLPAQEPKKP